MMDISTAFVEFVSNPTKLAVSLSSVTFAVLILLKLRNKNLSIQKKYL